MSALIEYNHMISRVEVIEFKNISKRTGLRSLTTTQDGLSLRSHKNIINYAFVYYTH